MDIIIQFTGDKTNKNGYCGKETQVSISIHKMIRVSNKNIVSISKLLLFIKCISRKNFNEKKDKIYLIATEA
ncbi:MAG: hypothetical protein E6001_06175 [Haemophilus parainfluenzae]|nr:hypothetical protein [Haemophilus parainfluenzae]